MDIRCILISAFLILNVGCETESNDSETNTEPPSTPDDGCVRYTSEPFTVNDDGGWDAPNTIINRSISIPNDRGGGYVRYRAVGGRSSDPTFVVRDEGFSGGAITSGSSRNTSSPHTRVGGFAVAPGERYAVEIADFYNCTHYDPPPCPLLFTWEYIPRLDCYEPNDQLDDAKRIPVDTLIDAYMIGGFIGNFYLRERLEDWYYFELDEEAEVSIRIPLGPGDIRMAFQVFDQQGASLFSQLAGSAGEYPLTQTRILPAGRYDIIVDAAEIDGEWRQEESTPDAFRHKYYMEVLTNPDVDPTCEVSPASGFAGFSETFNSPADSYTLTRTEVFDGSGYLRFSAGGLFEPRVTVQAAGEVISTSEAINGKVSVYVEAKPDVEYTYRVEQVADAPEYPVDLIGLFEFRNRNDCYEPNDSVDEAKEIPENSEIFAYFIAGNDGAAPAAADYADWYSFDLLLPSTIKLQVHELPGTVATRVRLYDEMNRQLREISPASVESVDWGVIDGGKYFLAFEPVTVLSSSVGVGPDNPPHFDIPYRFTVETEVAP